MNGDSPCEPSREELIALIAAQAAKIAALEARIAELERRLGLNSSNSGKPPSSDGLSKPPRVRSLREPSDKPSGGQKGHKGDTLRQVAVPDRTVDHYPPSCATCGLTVSPTMSTGHSVRQVFDLPEPASLVITEHRAHDCRCSGCGARTRAWFPDGINAPVQYGPRIAAFVTYLLHYQLLPEDRLAELMADLFGVKLAAATIAQMSRTCAARLQAFVITVRDLVAGAPVKHMDETGFRIGGQTKWLHIASTGLLTFYRISGSRGSVPEHVSGTIVHDHWKPYYTMTGVLHALCNTHHLRELKALIDIEKEDWARKMQVLLRRACHATNIARERGVVLTARLIARIQQRYETIIAEGIAFHEAQPALGRGQRRGRKPRRVGHNLLLRLQQRSDDVLRFLSDPDVPFTNTQAERDARMMKLRQKISGGFRSRSGADDFAIVRGAISTAKKQKWNILETLTRDPQEMIYALRPG